MGVTIRHFFNTNHARRSPPWWTWGVTVALFLACVWLSSIGLQDQNADAPDKASMTPRQTQLAAAPGFDKVRDIVVSRCSMCHAATPVWEGLVTAPRHIRLQSDAEITRAARDIYLQAGLTDAMPPANVSAMEAGERAAIRDWFRAARGG
jgi:uncharacterized membrane protein